MRRKPRIRTDVPTLWLCKYTNTLRVIWPDKSVWFFGNISSQWGPSYMRAYLVRKHSYYCGPLFVSKENEP